MRVPPYERTITEIGFRRIDQSVSILNHHSTVRPLLRNFIMVRPTVPDDVLHVRTADVWIGVVFTKSPNGVKSGGLLGLFLAQSCQSETSAIWSLSGGKRTSREQLISVALAVMVSSSEEA
jgi:hypothetical protein